ncbi:helix-turn-helix domain-containing protein [Haliangium sp.]|uniref:helix-turn-helix domain-containing protein n=1 Tax=Haliangium sp. TaxID=2663208 RepID=UPI003D144E30
MTARHERAMSIDEISGVTRIPVRSLERLESGRFEELPADVFVRGFLRSYARCVGLDEEDTIRRYTRCGMPPAPVATPMADELASSLATLHDDAPGTVRPCPSRVQTVAPESADGDSLERCASEPPAEVAAGDAAAMEMATDDGGGDTQVTAPAQTAASPEEGAALSGRKRKRKRRRRQRREEAVARAPNADEIVADEIVADEIVADETAVAQSVDAAGEGPASAPEGPGEGPDAEPPEVEVAEVVEGDPGMEAAARSMSGSPNVSAHAIDGGDGARAHRGPILVIDDADPEAAERRLRERAERSEASWRSLLPPSLLEGEEESNRGALTLAVIILVIVATLTMSYLLRRPDVSGDGVTQLESRVPASAPRALPSA